MSGRESMSITALPTHEGIFCVNVWRDVDVELFLLPPPYIRALLGRKPICWIGIFHSILPGRALHLPHGQLTDNIPNVFCKWSVFACFSLVTLAPTIKLFRNSIAWEIFLFCRLFSLLFVLVMLVGSCLNFYRPLLWRRLRQVVVHFVGVNLSMRPSHLHFFQTDLLDDGTQSNCTSVWHGGSDNIE